MLVQWDCSHHHHVAEGILSTMFHTPIYRIILGFTRWHFNRTYARLCTCIGPRAEIKGCVLGCKRGCVCPIHLPRASCG